MLHGQTRYNIIALLRRLPEESLKWLSPKVQANWFGNRKSAWDEAPRVVSLGSDNAIAQKIAQKATAALAHR